MQGMSPKAGDEKRVENAIRRTPVPVERKRGWGKNPEVGGKCPDGRSETNRLIGPVKSR
jgi:hypothetical protein